MLIGKVYFVLRLLRHIENLIIVSKNTSSKNVSKSTAPKQERRQKQKWHFLFRNLATAVRSAMPPMVYMNEEKERGLEIILQAVALFKDLSNIFQTHLQNDVR